MFASFNARAVGLMGLSASTTIDLAADAGFEGVDLMVRDLVLNGENVAELLSRMEDRGIKGGAFPLPFNWRGDENSFQRDLESLPKLAEVAGRLGLKSTGTWVMPDLPEPDSDPREIARLHVRRIGQIARIFHDQGIRLGLEVIGVESFRTGKGSSFVRRLGDLDPILGAIWDEAPNLGILLDAFHLHAADEPIEAGLHWGIERVVWVHVADLPPEANPIDRKGILDANRGFPGENGAINVRAFLSRLATEGYEGPVTAEPLARCQSLNGLAPDVLARRVKTSLDAVWPDC